jgi:2-polyprenyl-6-hydroxyphenyl methylase/3-demethylubiquinone-9 3-methyltransferase
MNDRKNIETHFAFGRNWASYAAGIGETQIEEAKIGLLKLIPAEEFIGRSFLDIGCGSGLHALAAAQLGVGRILAIDIDPDCAATSRSLLSKNDLSIPWEVNTLTVFDLDPKQEGTFDIVYSWGVLHHTGAMWEAVGKSASMVAANGLLALALYRRTRMDSFWKVEKRLYSHAPELLQRVIRAAYVTAFKLSVVGPGETLKGYLANHSLSRGMDFYHDVHDWLGGYPYETALVSEVESKLVALGFQAERVFAKPSKPLQIGIFSCGCNEYVYRFSGSRFR